jgi:rod shape-determining protein MreC
MFSRSPVQRRRAVLAVLLAVSLVLLTIYFSESVGGGLHAMQRGAGEVLSPLEEGASRAFKPFSDLAGWVGDVADAKKENKQLK